MKDKNHMIMSDGEKAFEKIHLIYMIKTLNKMGLEGTYLNLIKTTYEKHIANIIFTSETLRSGTRQGRPLSPLLIQHSTGSPSYSNQTT